MITIPSNLGSGGSNLPALASILTELQGLSFALLAGASSGTKIDLAAIRTEDSFLAVVENNAGTLTDRTSIATIVDTHASGTLTVAAVNDADTCVVNSVTYTFKDTPTALNHVKRTAGDNNANASALAAAINAYEARRLPNNGDWNAPVVNAVAASAVVTVTALEDGTAGNAITLTGTAVRLAASGSGTLAGGTATGGIKIAADTSAHQVVVFWYNKR